nr:ankyrin repeat protein [Megavirus caiporensis]
MQNQMIIDESSQCEHPNNEPIIYQSSNFDVYNGKIHRTGLNDMPSIIQSSTPNVWYTNNGGAIAINVSSIRSKN